MSRILVKNIPNYCDQDRLKKIFSREGKYNLTDLKLVKTSSGRSRRFAYVGFKTEEQAVEAIKYFDKSFIDTARITVEIAKTIGDESIPRAWSKYSTSSSAYQNLHKEKEEKREAKSQELSEKQKQFLADIDSEDEQFKEFLSVMRPRNAAASRTWANDDGVLEPSSAKKPLVPFPSNPDDDLYQTLPDKNSEEEESDTEQVERKDDSEDQRDIVFDESISDLEYLKMKMKGKESSEKQEPTEAPKPEILNVNPARLAFLQQVGAVGDEINNVQTTEGVDSIPQEELPHVEEEIVQEDHNMGNLFEPPSPDMIADTGRIMVRNLAYSCTHEELEDHFKRFGPIAEVHLPIDKITKESKGYAFILYVIPENAVQAFTDLDKTIFQGRIIEIVAAKEKPKSADEIVPAGPQNFKAKREKEKKANASNDFNWNSLFMNSDAVAEAMARNLGVKKGEILDKDASDMAVRLALAETNIITETKKYLEENDVSLEAFTNKKKSRSPTIILVKNLPANTEEDDLVELFAKFGTLGRVILPPARTLALIEFTERNEAKVAFRKLAYSKFKSVPLYLEWAAEGTFKSEFDPTVEAEKKKKREDELTIKISDDKDKEDLPPAATIFVKNLNFETTDEGLRRAFEGVGGLRSARISKKSNPKNPAIKLSMGFGFLEFDSKENAMKCIKTMQHFNLDGHELSLKFSNNSMKPSHSTKKRTVDQAENEDATKLLIRNLPFEATKQDLKKLFSSFGALKTVRVPKKFDGKHRGFAFIDFLTHQEAKNALDALGATHLYGRHLVLEWAKEEETVDEMREKTAKKYSKETPMKKQRVEMEGEDLEDY